MQTIRFQLNVRFNADSNISLSTEHFVNDESEAYRAGIESKNLVNEFLRGYGEEATEEEDA
jgi:hypothetical protein